jgi:hypothetical protein
VPKVRGARNDRGRAFDAFDLEAECRGAVARTHGADDLRGYRRTK